MSICVIVIIISIIMISSSSSGSSSSSRSSRSSSSTTTIISRLGTEPPLGVSLVGRALVPRMARMLSTLGLATRHLSERPRGSVTFGIS